MDKWKLFITISICIIFLTLVLLAVAWIVVLKHETTIPAPPGFAESGLGMRCTPSTSTLTSSTSGNPADFIPQQCASGMDCIVIDTSSSWGYCYTALGQECVSLLECVPDAIKCTGVCSTSASGSLNEPCNPNQPCLGEYLTCNTATNICSINAPESISSLNCFQNSDCLSGFCFNPGTSGSCLSLLPNGENCTGYGNDICESGNCDMTDNAYYCQNQGIKTGNQGAACFIYTGGGIASLPTCGVDLICSTYTNSSSPLANGYGTCQAPTSSWPDAGCSNTVGCPPPTTCNGSGQCVLPSNPNACDESTTGLCIHGYTCTGGFCSPSSGLPSASGTTTGIVSWNNLASGGGAIGEWDTVVTDLAVEPVSEEYSVSTSGTYSVSTYGSTLTALDYGNSSGTASTLYCYFGASTSLNLGSSTSVNVYFISGVNVYPLSITYTYASYDSTYTITNPITQIILCGAKINANNSLLLHFKITLGGVNYILPWTTQLAPTDIAANCTYTITHPLDLESTIVTTNGTTTSSTTYTLETGNLIDGAVFNNDDILEIALDGRSISGYTVLLFRGCGGIYTYDLIEGSDAFTNTYLSLNTLASGYYAAKAFPYLFYRNVEASSEGTTPDNATNTFYVNSSGSLAIMINGSPVTSSQSTISSYPLSSETSGSVFSASVSYPCGASLSQLYIAYTLNSNGNYYLHYAPNGEDRVMPGYFNASTLPCISTVCTLSGNTVPQGWTPRLSVLTSLA